MYQENVIIKFNKKLNHNYYHLQLETKKIAKKIKCGQFIFIKVTDNYEPFLRRPFSVAWTDKNKLNIIYKVFGDGTTILSKRFTGETLNILGPLGNGYNIVKAKKVALVGGGIGIASLISLMRTKNFSTDNISLFYGVKSKKEMLPKEMINIASKNINYISEDDSLAKKGFVTLPLQTYFEENRENDIYVYCCGPLPMLNAVARLAKEYNIKGEANFEERMGCGVGACLGCAVNLKGIVKTVCKDGPVFRFDELI